MSAYMEIDTLNRLTGEGAVVSAAALFVEPSALAALSRRFKQLPVIESVSMKAYTLDLLPRQDRRPRSRQRRHPHGLCGDRRGRRGLQQRPHRAAGARLGACQPARARLHAGRGGAHPCSASSRSRSRWQFRSARAVAGHRHLIGRFHSNESFQIPGVDRPTNLRRRRHRRGRRRRGQRIHRAPPGRPARSGRGTQDEGLTMRITLGRVVIRARAFAAVAGGRLVPDAEPIPVETATVTKGRLSPPSTRMAKPASASAMWWPRRSPGRLTRVRLKAGDTVAADDIVATILPPPAPLLDPRSRREAEERLGTAEAARERSKATVERAQAQADQAKTDLDRARTLGSRAAPRPCRRWNAPNWRAGRRSRPSGRGIPGSCGEPRGRSGEGLAARYRMAGTHRSNAGTSRRRYPAWC